MGRITSSGCARNDRITRDEVECDPVVPGAATSLYAETLKRVAILMMTNVVAQIANRIQKPPSGAGFFRGG